MIEVVSQRSGSGDQKDTASPSKGRLRLLPGVSLHYCADWATVGFDEPRLALSSAVVGGGLGRVDRWLNMKVRHDGDAVEDLKCPADEVAALCRACSWQGRVLGMLTAATMQSLRIRRARVEDDFFAVVTTTGLGNARRAGDRAEYRQLGEAPMCADTINLGIFTSARLDPTVLVDAVITVTEAKVAALQTLGILSPISDALATGTGTDAVAIFSGSGPTNVPYAGKHTLFGELIARLTLSAVTDSIQQSGARDDELGIGEFL